MRPPLVYGISKTKLVYIFQEKPLKRHLRLQFERKNLLKNRYNSWLISWNLNYGGKTWIWNAFLTVFLPYSLKIFSRPLWSFAQTLLKSCKIGRMLCCISLISFCILSIMHLIKVYSMQHGFLKMWPREYSARLSPFFSLLTSKWLWETCNAVCKRKGQTNRLRAFWPPQKPIAIRDGVPFLCTTSLKKRLNPIKVRKPSFILNGASSSFISWFLKTLSGQKNVVIFGWI